jgi:hypothetical protein
LCLRVRKVLLGASLPRHLASPVVEMFRRHYDKCLENYEAYVKLAARLQQRGFSR